MNIWIPILILAAIGLIAGLGLAIASKVMAVPVDEREQQLRAALPGANCGACGFSGCDGYAKALADSTAESTALCAPGGAETAQKIADILGVKADAVTPKKALVRCRGCREYTQPRMRYTGLQSCRAANQLYGGPGACAYGCIGFGDCVQACDYGALSLREGVAAVDPERCTACGKCVKVCPKGLIELFPAGRTAAAVLCSSRDKGARTRAACRAGCIGCRKCEKLCEAGAVEVRSNLAHIDPEKCTGCGRCAQGCPQQCIALLPLAESPSHPS